MLSFLLSLIFSKLKQNIVLHHGVLSFWTYTCLKELNIDIFYKKKSYFDIIIFK